MTCERCEVGLWHCHGTLVQHEDGLLTCTEPACLGEIAVHDFVIEAGDLLEGAGSHGSGHLSQRARGERSSA